MMALCRSLMEIGPFDYVSMAVNHDRELHSWTAFENRLSGRC